MHTLPFEMKRAHLASIRLTRDLCAQVGLTPARLDMVRAIFAQCNSIRQSELRHHLGVTKVVVSIMVRALEKLGFVRRTRCFQDGRTFVLEVLAKGRIALRRIYYESRTIPFLANAFDEAFGRRSESNKPCEVHVLEYHLRQFRDAFGLPSPVESERPWEWNDDDPCFYWGTYTDNLAVVDMVPDDEIDTIDDDGLLTFVPDVDRKFGDRAPAAMKLPFFTFVDWVRLQPST